MEKKIATEVVEVNGAKYLTSDDRITKDYITGNWIIKRFAEKHVIEIELTVNNGATGVMQWGYTAERDIPFSLRTARFGAIPISQHCAIKGDGRMHAMEGAEGVFLDDVLFKRENANKFRPFNNQVRAFDDYDNIHLSSSEKSALYQRDLLFGVRTMTNKVFEGLNYTFGVELETSSGRITEQECEGLNLKCEFDGSLRETPDQRREDVLGGEYITGVLIGDAGVNQLHRICNKLSEKCTINSKCGVHVHVGNIKFSKANIVYMYALGMMLQDEILSLLPLSRRENSYCRKLTNLNIPVSKLNTVKTSLMYRILIDEYYHIIHKEVSGGRLPDKRCNKKTNHPQGSKCGYDKNAQRYCWLNFVTAMFNTKNSPKAMTLEFRPHHATLNYSKVKNWLKICIAFVNFAENHQDSIRRGYWIDKDGNKMNINLATIIKAAYPRNYCLLEQYISERTSYFLKDNGDIEKIEYLKDKEGIRKLTFKESVCV